MTTPAGIASTAPKKTKEAGRLTTALLLAPAGFWFLLLLLLPMAVVIVYSFGVRAATGGYQAAFTFQNYLDLPARLTAFKNTLTLAPAGTLICLLIGYPLAYYLAVKASAKSRLFLMILVIVPFWTSFLIRTYACMLVFILLMGEYLIPQLLGGGKVFFIGNALVDLFLQSLNWPFGSACAVALVAIMMGTISLYLRITRAQGQRDVSLM